MKVASSAQNKELGALALSEADDAIEVLVGGGLHRRAQRNFDQAKRNIQSAIDASTLTQRIDQLNKALNNLQMAKNDIVSP